jgi:hypothetical protein
LSSVGAVLKSFDLELPDLSPEFDEKLLQYLCAASPCRHNEFAV